MVWVQPPTTRCPPVPAKPTLHALAAQRFEGSTAAKPILPRFPVISLLPCGPRSFNPRIRCLAGNVAVPSDESGEPRLLEAVRLSLKSADVHVKQLRVPKRLIILQSLDEWVATKT
jgi:hypothetical protein